MEQIENSLIEAGLTRNEAKIYRALLKLGTATVLDLTKAAGVHRVNVYDVVDRLHEKGLISSVIQANKRIYQPSDPHQLIELVKEKEELLVKIMPLLQEEFQSKKEKQEVHHFLGPEGLMRAYYMMLDQNSTIYGIGGQGLNRKYLQHRHDLWNKERLKRKIRGKVIYFESARNDKDKGWKDMTMQIRYFPDDYKTTSMINICGNLVINLIPKENNVAAIVIENPTLAESYRKLFEFMWQFARQ